MRRILFTLLASGALFAAVPAVSLAHGGHHHRSHARTVRHHGIRHEHFAGTGSSTGSPTGSPVASQNAGTVASFTNGILAITLADGSTVNGAVTSATELECEAAAPMQTMDRGPSGGDNGNGDNNGDNAGDNGGNGGNGDVGDNNNMCTTITPGMVVREANLTLTGSGAAWDRVDLIGS
jgi:hypothetical protein